MSIFNFGTIQIFSLLIFALFWPITVKSSVTKGLDSGGLDQNRSLSFTLRWKKLRIAEMLFSVSGENEEYWSISGRTLGPLRLVKNYEGEAIQSYDIDGEKYRLEGRDQGFLEEREILFRSGNLPLVREFIDRTAEISLTPKLPWGKVAVSPIGLFRQIINSSRSPFSCNGSIVVYDGKRTYTVNLNGSRAQEKDLRLLNLSGFAERFFWKCSATLGSGTLVQSSRDLGVESKETLKEFSTEERVNNDVSTDLRWSGVWFFGFGERRVDFVLSADCAVFELVGMLISSPLGQIVGQPTDACN